MSVPTRQQWGTMSGVIDYKLTGGVVGGHYGFAVSATAGSEPIALRKVLVWLLAQPTAELAFRVLVLRGVLPANIGPANAVGGPGNTYPLNTALQLPFEVLYERIIQQATTPTSSAGFTIAEDFLDGMAPTVGAGETMTCVLVPLMDPTRASLTMYQFCGITAFGGPIASTLVQPGAALQARALAREALR